MDEKTSNTNQTSTTQSTTVIASQDGSAAVKIESPAAGGTEHRQAYGTAKTENLRDSGAWRFVLPAFVVLLCLALLAIPLLILGPLLYGSFAPQQHVQLTWVWIVMILIEVGTAAVIIWGLVKIFMTQAGNYSE
jgi:hypothetical protein